jgi:CDP-diacylglycerol--glycerol-3-phosphate 3-phosphatidyltransferase
MKIPEIFTKIHYILFRSKAEVRMVNLISFYRIFSFPYLLLFIFTGHLDIVKWLIAFSFFTDMVDGYLARKHNASSILGAKLDSIGDDLTILAGLIGVIVHFPEFLIDEIWVIGGMLILFVIQTIFALRRYGKPTSFHTYLAKISAFFQGFFFISLFFYGEPVYWLFYATAIVTSADLLEEIIIVVILPEWKSNVKGLYWILRKKVELKL